MSIILFGFAFLCVVFGAYTIGSLLLMASYIRPKERRYPGKSRRPRL